MSAAVCADGVLRSEYHLRPSLSQSGIKAMMVSPLQCWHDYINPDRVEPEPSPEQKFGTALHRLVLEGEQSFRAEYAEMIDESDYPEALVTMDDLRGWLRDKGQTPKGTRKADLIAQALAVDPGVQIWDRLVAKHEAATAGKMLCLKEDWQRIWGAANALWNEPELEQILQYGEAEVPIYSTDPDTGVPLKGLLDWLAPSCILDLKTFTARRGKSIDECVADSIFYEAHYRQAYLYSTMHQRVNRLRKPLRFVLAFVESHEPFEVRIRELTPTTLHGVPGIENLYWQRAALEVRHACETWARCMEIFGVRNPWRDSQAITPLRDDEMRGLAY